MSKRITSQIILLLVGLLPMTSFAQNNQSDLIISNLEVIDPISANYDISYQYQITNIGNETASTNGVSVQAFISSDPVFSPQTDIAAGGKVLGVSQIPPGQTITQSFGATVQYNTVTHPYLTMKVDWQDALNETKEGNNFAWTGIVPPPQEPVLNEEVVQSQIIIDYDLYTPESIIILQNLLNSLGGVETERCNCERGIAVWQFDSDEAARDALTEIDNRSDTIETVAEVDDNDGVDGNELISLVLGNPMFGFELRPEQVPAARQDVLVYLIDSGLNTDHLPNRNNLLNSAPTYNCTDVSGEGYNYEDPPRINSNFDDENGHGTFGYRAITRGLSSRIKVVPLKVFNEDGQGTLFGMICAIYHAIDNGADIVNISAGYQGEENRILKSAVKEAKDLGIFIVTAAGNDEKSIDTYRQYPAVYAKDFPNVISVASQNPANGKLGKCSNHGKQTVTMAAAGERICGYDHEGEKVIRSGTSIATFYVTRNLAIQLSTQAPSRTNPAATKNEFLGRQESNCLVDKTKEGKCLKVNAVPCSIPFLQWLGQLFD